MKNKQTAIRWFAEQLGITNGSMLEQAIEMERDQMERAYVTGYSLSVLDQVLRDQDVPESTLATNGFEKYYGTHYD